METENKEPVECEDSEPSGYSALLNDGGYNAGIQGILNAGPVLPSSDTNSLVAFLIASVGKTTLQEFTRAEGFTRRPNVGNQKTRAHSGKHTTDVSRSRRSIGEASGSSYPTATMPQGSANALKESQDSIVTATPFSGHPCAPMINASAIQNAANVTDERIIVEATYMENTVRFEFSRSSGLSNLKGEVALRFELESGKFNLYYLDDERDVILVPCNADLDMHVKEVLATSGGKNTIQLFVKKA